MREARKKWYHANKNSDNDRILIKQREYSR